MTYKTRAIQYKRDGTERYEHQIIDDAEFIKTCSPTVWHKVNLPDMTPPDTLERCAKLRYIATRTQFNQRVVDYLWLRAANAGDKPHTALCAHLGIRV